MRWHVDGVGARGVGGLGGGEGGEEEGEEGELESHFCGGGLVDGGAFVCIECRLREGIDLESLSVRKSGRNSEETHVEVK